MEQIIFISILVYVVADAVTMYQDFKLIYLQAEINRKKLILANIEEERLNRLQEIEDAKPKFIYDITITELHFHERDEILNDVHAMMQKAPQNFQDN